MGDEVCSSVTCSESLNSDSAGCVKQSETKKIDLDDLPTTVCENEKKNRKETETNSSSVHLATKISNSDARESHDSRRKFRIVGLKFPGNWLQNEKLMEILNKSESFHMWFEKVDKDGKTGGASIVFETIEDAKTSFSNLYKLSSDSFRLQASRQFYDNLSTPSTQLQSIRSLPFKVDTSDVDCPRRLYAVHLTSSTDRTLLSSIIGSETIEHIHIENDPSVPNEKQAEITFRSVEEANDAKEELADGFEIDEGDRQSLMRLLTADEYLAFMKKDENSRASLPHSNAPGLSASSSQCMPDINQHQIAPESSSIHQSASLTLEDVTTLLKQHIINTRTNWAELNELDELWRLCDDVSHKQHGIPDSLLKPALLDILDEHQKSLPSAWMKQHVDALIKIWKREMQNTKSMQRPTAFVMIAPMCSPPANYVRTKKPRLNKDRRIALRTMMGVGAMLNQLRSKMVTEDGEVDIEEDNEGNIIIDGQKLTFETWGKIHKDDKLTATHFSSGMPLQSSLSESTEDTRKRKLHKEKSSLKSDFDAVISPTSSRVDVRETRQDKSSSKELSNAELEEGEMKSSSPSSSSSSSSSDEGMSSKNKKKRASKKRRSNPSFQFASLIQNPHLTALFNQMYEQRHVLIKSLSPEHKRAFAKILIQILQSPREMTSMQQDMISMFIRNFSKQSFGSK